MNETNKHDYNDYTGTWIACDHLNGFYQTIKVLWFKKRYFFCTDCEEMIEEKYIKLLK